MLRLFNKCPPVSLLSIAMQLPLIITITITITITSVMSLTSMPPTQDYCEPSLCEVYNGSHILQTSNTACGNNGSFGDSCGPKPKLLYMSNRRRLLLLDMHNLVRAKVAAGEVEGYMAASSMPIVRWDMELEHMAELHAKRCLFAHDECRNTQRFKYSGQNIGYFWIGREFKSHSKRMKSFVLNWFREFKDANQTFIDSYHPHPEGKKIGHFTLLVADRVQRVGCAAVRFLEASSNRYQFLMTCNYDYNNIYAEPVYRTGPAASQCEDRISSKYPALCYWKPDDSEGDDNNMLDNNITV